MAGRPTFFTAASSASTIGDRRELRCRDAQLLEKMLLAQAVLRRFQRGGRRKYGDALGEKANRGDGNVFEFVGDQLEAVGEFLKRRFIGKFRGDARRDASDRGFRRRIEKSKMEAQRIARKRQHVAELSAAENADRHAGFLFAGAS